MIARRPLAIGWTWLAGAGVVLALVDDPIRVTPVVADRAVSVSFVAPTVVPARGMLNVIGLAPAHVSFAGARLRSTRSCTELLVGSGAACPDFHMTTKYSVPLVSCVRISACPPSERQPSSPHPSVTPATVGSSVNGPAHPPEDV